MCAKYACAPRNLQSTDFQTSNTVKLSQRLLGTTINTQISDLSRKSVSETEYTEREAWSGSWWFHISGKGDNPNKHSSMSLS